MAGLILGTKGKQSQRFTDEGVRLAVTKIITSPCYLVGVKAQDTHGYMSIMLGAGVAKKINKPQARQLEKAGVKTPLRFLREARLERYGDSVEVVEENGKKGIKVGDAALYVGDQIKPSQWFAKGEKVVVSGTSKGKGFAGVVKRHGFAGGPRTHGQSDRERAPGSIGASTTPGRVMKGKPMAGRMGAARVTVKNLEVVEVLPDGLLIKGLVPGATGAFLEVKSSSRILSKAQPTPEDHPTATPLPTEITEPPKPNIEKQKAKEEKEQRMEEEKEVEKQDKKETKAEVKDTKQAAAPRQEPKEENKKEEEETKS